MKTNKKLNDNKKRLVQVIGFSVSIFLLVLTLLLILIFKNDNNLKTQGIMKDFYQYYENKEARVIYYYDSSNAENDYSVYELDYLIQIYKDYKIDYLVIDSSALNINNRKEIENTLGIKGETPTIVIVKDKNIVAIQQGFLESHKLVEFLVETSILNEDSKYKPVDNLNFIDYEEYLNILDNDKRNIIMIGEAGCGYCISAKPILNNISKGYKLTINYLDIYDLKQEEYIELFKKLPSLGYDNSQLIEENTFPMPTLLIIENGKVTSYLKNYRSLEEYVGYFKVQGFIE